MPTLANAKKPSLFAAIAIGVGCIVGSGWLFAPYYAAKYAGGISLLAWIFGAALALILALLLSELSTMYHARGLLARLLSFSHNRDYGFVSAISNWLGVVITIPSEAEATVQYLSSMSPKFGAYVFQHHHLTMLGIAFVGALVLLFGIINYWGIRSLTKFNNAITTFKVIIPVATAIILIAASFHAANFTAYHNSFAPYGVSKAFSAIVVCGIFYAFYGFGTIASFNTELKNPQRNVPIALISSVIICLVIYLLLQIAFIGALPTHLIANGWHGLNFTSPLAQLLILLNINFWAVVLYIDSTISPSGTATVYTGSSTRMFTGMVEDKQMPAFFNKVHPIYNFSRRSLVLTLLICMIIVVFFRNWQKIMLVVTTFQLITCVAIPIAFSKLRLSEPNKKRAFKLRFGHAISFLAFLFVTYLMTQVGIEALLLSTILHFVFFSVYAVSFYKGDLKKIKLAFASSWSILFYLVCTTLFGFLSDQHLLYQPSIIAAFIVVTVAMYWFMISQKTYNLEA